MKRKFSFNLAPAKMSSKEKDASAKTSAEPSPAHIQPTHQRHYSKDSTDSVFDSPYINRRPLDAVTERELRVACAKILRNFKPSDHGIDADPKLDFQGMNRHREQRDPRGYKPSSEQVQVRRPTGAPAETSSAQAPRASSSKAAPSAKRDVEAPMPQANTGRRRADHENQNREPGRGNLRAATNESTRPMIPRQETDSEDGKSVGTSVTGSTDHHLHPASTAPTSAAFTSGRSSKRMSNQLEIPAAVADARAAEWMRQEMEKRQQLGATGGHTQQAQKAPARPPTRSRSIRSLFSSASISRKQSLDSLRPTDVGSPEPRRSNSSHGWRSWGLQRKSSSRASSRPTTSKGNSLAHLEDKKSDVDLNRELPPLPSLDTWKPEVPPPEEPNTSKASNAHIATLMRPHDKQQQDYAAAVRRHHRRSGSDTQALKQGSMPQKPSSQIARSQSQLKMRDKAASKNGLLDFDKMMAALDSREDLGAPQKLKLKGHSHHQSSGGSSRGKMSLDSSHLAAPNFSRKISADVPRSPHIYDHDGRYQNTVLISGRLESKDENKSKLKRALSGWMVRKTKKDDWMNEVEKKGAKSGLMEQQEAASAPVVRY